MKERKPRILVVDDEVDICRALEFLLSREGYEVKTAQSGERAVELLQKKSYDLVLSDLRMDGMDGLALLQHVHDEYPDIVFIIMTAFASVETAVSAMKEGAVDYIVKPFVNDDVKMTVRRLLKSRALEAENESLKRQLSGRLESNKFIGDSPPVRELFQMIEKIMPTRSNILILGDSGSGKGLVAELIHFNSPRRDKAFLSVNCSAIPETLLESELFGYKRGAFTGANADKPGLIVAADEGTLFLDEIGDMPLSVQSKLLKVLEDGEVTPLGDVKPRLVDVRFIAATNSHLEEAVHAGKFREDLFYRLDVIELKIPSLRERREDIPLVAAHYLKKFNRAYEKSITGFTEEASRILMDYPWPGNVRELGNVIERAVVLSSGMEIDWKDLPERVRSERIDHMDTLKDAVSLYERTVILDRLALHGGNKEETARDLGVDLATLYRKMKKLSIS